MGKPLSEAQRAARRKGGQNRAKSFTPEYQSRASRSQSREQKAAAGRAGFKATMAKHGPSVAYAGLARHLLERGPSKLEQVVIGWLDQYSLAYQREVCLKDLAPVDFLLLGNVVVEVDGCHWHQNTNQETRDRIKDRELTHMGYHVIRLGEVEIENGSGLPRLMEFIRGIE